MNFLFQAQHATFWGGYCLKKYLDYFFIKNDDTLSKVKDNDLTMSQWRLGKFDEEGNPIQNKDEVLQQKRLPEVNMFNELNA